MSRTLVVELNEVPLRVLRFAADRNKLSSVQRLLHEGVVAETELREQLPREPYPSQSWASMNMGVPYNDHQVWWYGEEKPLEYPLYWQAAANEGRTVGLVGSLHTSPLRRQASGAAYQFVLPDAFAESDEATPVQLEGVQRFVRTMAQRNARTSSLSLDRKILRDLTSLRRLGLRPSTIAELGKLTASVATRRASSERLRSAQFLLMGDLFESLMKRHDPDLGVIFSNHVAAAMHRFWFASFPADFSEQHYSAEWIAANEHEIPFAVGLVDRFLARAMSYCEATNRTLVVASSMGQGAAQSLDASSTHEAIVVDGQRFLRQLGVETSFELRGAMVPQLTAEFATEADARHAAIVVNGASLDFDIVHTDVNGPTLTVSYRLALDNAQPTQDGSAVSPASIGVEIQSIADHSSGEHTPLGSLIIFNAQRPFVENGDVIDALDYAPGMLAMMGLAPLPHHRRPAAV